MAVIDDSPALEPEDIDAAISLIEGAEADVAATVTGALADLNLTAPAWADVQAATVRRLRQAEPDFVQSAARVPLPATRRVIVHLAVDDDEAVAGAAVRGLVEADPARVPAAVVRTGRLERHLDLLQLMSLPASTLSVLGLEAPDLGGDLDPGHLFRAVALAKAGDLEPLRTILTRMRHGDAPGIFVGNPHALVEDLERARPIPDPVERLLLDEVDAYPSEGLSWLLQGLVPEEPVSPPTGGQAFRTWRRGRRWRRWRW